MTSEQFVERYNKTAAECFFGHRIQLSNETPRKLLHRHQQRVAGGGSISFMLTESGGMVRDVSMFDTDAFAPGHRQLHSIAASIMVDVLTGLPKAERKAVIEQLGLPRGEYGAEVPIGPEYIGKAQIVAEAPRHTLLVQLRYIRRGKNITCQ